MIEVRTPDETQVERLAAVLSQCFNFTAEDAASWLDVAEAHNARVAVRDGEVVGGLLALPLGQYWGARRVPMAGLATVGIAPEHRGSGAATELVRETLIQVRERGDAISALYPSVLGLYRNLGYEIGGSRWQITVDPKAIGVSDRDLPLRAAQPDDVIGIRGAHLSRARRVPGSLDRSPFIWERVLQHRGAEARGYVVGRDRIEGYVFVGHEPRERGRYDVHVTDLVALTPEAGRRILSFFADHGSLAERITWRGPVEDPLLMQLASRDFQVRMVDPWMLRILDVRAALESRGWPAGARGRLELAISDPLIRDNDGRWTLDIADGNAAVRRGGRGAIRMDVRGLASLYTGHLSPIGLRAAGLISGDDAELLFASTAFAGPAPTMSDGY